MVEVSKPSVISQELAHLATDNTLAHECPDIYLDDKVMDLKFSPTENVIALTQVTGFVRLYAYAEDRMDEVGTYAHHKDSCRALAFNTDGKFLYIASRDKSFSVISQG